MYCKNCGKEIDDNAYVCIHCGALVNENKATKNGKLNIFALVGFILSFFFSVPGLVLSIIGYQKADTDYDGNMKNYAKAGIIISIVAFAISVILSIVYVVQLSAIFTALLNGLMNSTVQ